MSSPKKNIVWLASYPKSGNTWLRAFLSNLFSDADHEVNINHLGISSISSNRNIIDSYLGMHSSELTAKEIDNLRPQVYLELSKDTEGSAYVKTHEAWTLNSRGNPIFSKEITKGVIYIIRNPLDIAISYSFHNNDPVDQTISLLNNAGSALCEAKDRISVQTRQILGSWSNHVSSWTEHSGLPLHVIRYEDMLDHPLRTFKGVIDFLHLEYGDSEIRDAIKNSSFDTLRAMEAIDGFKERGIDSEVFFRKGTSNQWEHELSTNQINEIVKHHKKIMTTFGYSYQ